MTAPSPLRGADIDYDKGYLKELEKLVGETVHIDVASTATVPSSELKFGHVLELCTHIEKELREGVDGVVVSTGTDTLEEIAFALDLLVETNTPIVVTGAMRMKSDINYDGVSNLINAISVASTKRAQDQGVLVVFNGDILPAWTATKADTFSLNAFSASHGGPIGRVHEGAAHFFASSKWPARLVQPQTAPDSNVPMIQIGFDNDAYLLDRIVPGECSGLVVEALGGGHVPSRDAGALKKIAKDIPVILTHRCKHGAVLRTTYGYPGGEIDLLSHGLIHGGYLTPRKALVALKLLLSNNARRETIVDFFSTFAI